MTLSFIPNFRITIFTTLIYALSALMMKALLFDCYSIYIGERLKIIRYTNDDKSK